jgi:outer membrane protein TolC
VRALASLACLLALLPPARTAAADPCPDDDALEAPAATTAQTQQARATLQGLVREALERSHQIGAARLLAQAAEDDVREVRAAREIQASANAGAGPGGSESLAGSETSSLQLRAGANVAQLLYDGGRLARLTDWRSQIAEAARQGHLNAQEQVALQTVSLAFERSRWRQQAHVYTQHVRKMSCLVQALETIVRADRGRASELVQARKSQQQAEITLASALSQLRATEVRLRRFVGDSLPGTEGLDSLLLEVAPLPELVADVERSAEIAALAAQAQAASSYVDAVAAGTSPQVSWNIGGSHSSGWGGSRGHVKTSTWSLGIAVNIPLSSPGVAPATDAARKRARAAELQRADAIESKRFRVAEVYEQTVASLDRARRYGAVLKDSQQVRSSTLMQWQQLGRRSLFDVMAAESDHFSLRVAQVNALHDAQLSNATLLSLGRGLNEWLRR